MSKHSCITIIFLYLISLGHVSLAHNHGIYISGKLGYSHLSKLSDSQGVTSPIDNVTKVSYGYGYEFEPAFNFGIAIGKHFKQMRVELDLHHTRAQIENIIYKISISNNPNPDVNASETITTKSKGDFHGTFVGGNIYYDFNGLKTRNIVPYIGAGAGVSMLNIKDKVTTGKSSDENEIAVLYKDTKINENQFTFQGMLGANFYFNKNMSVSLEYRFSHANSFKFNTDWSKNSDAAEFLRSIDLATKDFEDSLITHSINVGIKAIIA